MKGFTMEDLKGFQKLHDSIIEKAQELADIRYAVDSKQDKLDIYEVFEVTDGQIGFRAEDKWSDNYYPYFDLEDFFDENYREKYSEFVLKRNEEEMKKKEEEKRKREEDNEKYERELLEKLKKKYKIKG